MIRKGEGPIKGRCVLKFVDLQRVNGRKINGERVIE